MSYETCRDTLIEAAEAVAGIKQVYTFAPATLGDVPAIVFFGNSGIMMWAAGGYVVPEEDNEERCRILVRDEDQDEAHKLTIGFRKAFLHALRSRGGLGQEGTITEVRWDVPANYNYGGGEYTGQDFYIKFVVNEPDD
jgi:hypothetical protein